MVSLYSAVPRWQRFTETRQQGGRRRSADATNILSVTVKTLQRNVAVPFSVQTRETNSSRQEPNAGGLPAFIPRTFFPCKLACVRNPTTASIAVRPCLSSDSRYSLSFSSLTLENPSGSKNPKGALVPTMSEAAMESAVFATGRGAEDTTRDPAKVADGTKAAALSRSRARTGREVGEGRRCERQLPRGSTKSSPRIRSCIFADELHDRDTTETGDETISS